MKGKLIEFGQLARTGVGMMLIFVVLGVALTGTHEILQTDEVYRVPLRQGLREAVLAYWQAGLIVGSWWLARFARTQWIEQHYRDEMLRGLGGIVGFAAVAALCGFYLYYKPFTGNPDSVGEFDAWTANQTLRLSLVCGLPAAVGAMNAGRAERAARKEQTKGQEA